MRQKMRISLSLIALTFLIGSCILLMISDIQTAHAFPAMMSLTKAASPSTVTTPSTPSRGFDSTLLAALIGLGGVILGLLVALYNAKYQTRRSERLQRDLAKQNERLQRDLAHQNEQLQRELVRTQKELEREQVLREQQEQQENI